MARIEQDELGELLSAYIDGELSAGETTFVEKLLREDATARELLEELRRTVETTASMPRHAAPASLVGDVQAMLERTALLDDVPPTAIHAHRDRAPWAARLSMAAMIVLVITGGWYFLQEPARRGSTPPESPVAARENAASKEVARAHRERTLMQPTEALAAADRRTVEQKLEAGVELVALRAHPFEAETVRLQLNVPDARERDELTRRVSRGLSEQKLADLGARADQDSSAKSGFYYRGSAGKNFSAAQESQILVRATPTQIEQVLQEVAKSGQPDSAATLVAGTLNVPGLQRSQSVLNAMSQSNAMSRQQGAAGARVAGDGKKKDAPSNDFATELFRIVGVDPALLSESHEEADKGQPAVAATDAASDKREVAEPGRTRREIAAGAKSSLVDQNLKKLEARAASPSVDEPLVTMIIQLVPPPAPPQPTTPSGPTQDNPPVRSNSGRSSS